MSEEKSIQFIGIGAIKSATTWVSEVLNQHPQIAFSKETSKKELRFFNTGGDPFYQKDNYSHFEKGVDWYLKQFPPYAKDKIRGEFSISYLSDIEAPGNIYNTFPNVKIIAVLRNPVDMLYSYYWFCRNTIELSVTEGYSDLIKNPNFIGRGKYFSQLSRYYDLFPVSNIHVILHDDIVKDPEKVIKNLYSFLEIDSTFVPTIVKKKVNEALSYRSVTFFKLVNKLIQLLNKHRFHSVIEYLVHNDFLYAIYKKLNVIHEKYPPQSPEDRKYVLKQLLSEIENLENLLGRDLRAWKKPDL